MSNQKNKTKVETTGPIERPTVEVFKTNVQNRRDAELLLKKIYETHVNYRANFDLEDCDRILRIESGRRIVNTEHIIRLLKKSGFTAEVLPDEIPNTSKGQTTGKVIVSFVL